MSNSQIVQRVVDLIRLAADSGASEHEARTAAFQAARLIVKHDLQVVDAHSTATATRTTTRTTTQTTTATWQQAWNDAWDRSWAKAQERVDREAHEKELIKARGYPWVAQEPQKCRTCRRTIATGAECYYGPDPKLSYRCVPCASRNAPPRPRTKRKKASSETTP